MFKSLFISLCIRCLLSTSVLGRLVPYYDLDDDYYSEVRNLLDEHLTRKVDSIGPIDHPREVRGWGVNSPIGQVTGVALDKNGNPVVFHRGSRVWNHRSFNATEHFQEPTPIKEDVVATLDKKTGRIIKAWGAGKFFLPHGIAIDSEGNFWFTDVGLHQVFKYSSTLQEPSLILGKKLEPGSDDAHFCKPTAVVVSSKGDFFVADGYCNARILHFNSDGSFKGKYGHFGREPEIGTLNVPHGLALDEDKDILAIADREHSRISCIRAGLKNPGSFGEDAGKLTVPNHARVFDIAFLGNELLGIAGSEEEGTATGFSANLKTGQIVDEWQPIQEFHNPHSICIDSKEEAVYVGEIGPNRVWKFVLETVPKVY